MRQFLQAIIPEEGYKAAFIKYPNRSFNQFAGSYEELEHYLRTHDAQGATVYHACAAFNEPTNRTQVNALGAKALWLDIDAGEGKPYADASIAAVQLARFARSAKLPPPTFIGSGGGIHAYWPLATTLDRNNWQRYAVALKTAATNLSFSADPARTADIASVLRPPETANRKWGRYVEAGPITGPYALDAFAHLLDLAPPEITTTPAPKLTGLLAAMAPDISYEPKFGTEVAERCQQLALFRNTQGQIPEPLWYAGLGVLAFCEDGYECGNDWSTGHPTYSEGETNARLERAGALSGATTCAKFYSLNPAGCAGCQFAGNITSPISLGKKEVQAPTPILELPQAAAANQETVNAAQAPELPDPYAWNTEGGLCLKVPQSTGPDQYQLISTYAIWLENVQVNEATGQSFSLLFKQYHPMAGLRDIIIPAKTLFGASGMSEMSGMGANVHNSTLFMNYVRTALDAYHKEQGVKLRYEQFGWKDDNSAFLYGDRLYRGYYDVERVIGTGEVAARAPKLQPSQRGSLERWREAGDTFFGLGSEARSVALLASFAAPLMRFHSRDEGGAILSIVSKSGGGKTTTLAAVQSVWGQDKSLSLQNIDTRTSKPILLGVLGNLPVMYDEFHNKDPQWTKEFVLVFTNGEDRKRGTVDGGLRHVENKWQTLLISASNQSLVDTLLAAGGTEAPAMRVLEFNLPAANFGDKSEGDRIKNQLYDNAGYAGDAYLRFITDPRGREWINQRLPAYTKEIWDAAKLSSEHRYWVRTVASIACAAAIVNHLEILHFTPSRIIDWAIAEMSNMATGGIAVKEEKSAVAILGDFLNDNARNMLVVQGAAIRGKTEPAIVREMPAHKLIARYELDTRTLYISDRVFREWLVRNEMPSRQVVLDLAKHQIIRRPRILRTLSAGTHLPGGQVPCIEIDGSHPMVMGLLAETQPATVDNRRIRLVSS